MKHQHAELLIAAANDKDARFTYPRGMAGEDPVSKSILCVLNHPNLPWKLAEKPDKWAKEKQAFKEGKTIQIKNSEGEFVDCSSEPFWLSINEYRIKPQTVTKWLWACPNGNISEVMMTEANYGYDVKLDWSATEFEVEE